MGFSSDIKSALVHEQAGRLHHKDRNDDRGPSSDAILTSRAKTEVGRDASRNPGNHRQERIDGSKTVALGDHAGKQGARNCHRRTMPES